MTISNKFTPSLLVLSLFSTSTVFAESAVTTDQRIYQDLTLNQATVFLRGAELENSVTLNLPAGQSEIILSNVADNIDQQTLAVSLDNNDVIINSINVKKIPTAPVYSSTVTALLNKQKEINKQIATLQIDISVGDEQLALLKELGNVSEGNTFSLEQSSQKLEFLSKKMTVILNEQSQAKDEIKKLTEQYEDITRQIEIESPIVTNEKTQLVLSLSTANSITSKIRISYITPDAAWAPTYDIRSQGLDKPIVLTYKADVIQNTGINWNKVKLTLTSTNPSNNIAAPILRPWYLSLYNDNAGRYKTSAIVESSAPAPMEKKGMDADSMKDLAGGVRNFVVTDNNGINLSRTINLPYTLKNSVEPSSLVIDQKEIKANYRYLTTPKLAEEVYLQAQVKDWESLNLLNGKANIYYMNNYIGTNFINTRQLSDLFNIPLGVDKNIQITRINNEKVRSEPIFIGSTIEQKESYTINIRNARTEPVKVTVYDQLPLSQENNISVSDGVYKEGTFNKETGQVEWNITLTPKQEKALQLNYTLSYPKNRQVIGL